LRSHEQLSLGLVKLGKELLVGGIQVPVCRRQCLGSAIDVFEDVVFIALTRKRAVRKTAHHDGHEDSPRAGNEGASVSGTRTEQTAM
jgi:hypothetical protein